MKASEIIDKLYLFQNKWNVFTGIKSREDLREKLENNLLPDLKVCCKNIQNNDKELIHIKGYTFDLSTMQKDNLWITGVITSNYGEKDKYKVDAKVYMDNSKYGINNGKISKLNVRNITEEYTAISYDRGWDIEPQKEEEIGLLGSLLVALENYRNKHLYIPDEELSEAMDLINSYKVYVEDKNIRKDIINRLKTITDINNIPTLSASLSWGFTNIDIVRLATEYSKNKDLQERIRDLLEDCNFHTDVDLLENGKAEDVIEKYTTIIKKDYLKEYTRFTQISLTNPCFNVEYFKMDKKEFDEDFMYDNYLTKKEFEDIIGEEEL